MAKNDLSGDHWTEVDQPFETEDDDLCPLCMEELDISDLNFRPCPCGYRICRFCWHHIKEDLNRRCPGCRKEYDDSVVEFKPMKAEELKRLQLAKKQRDKERKDLELVNRKHLANVRVKQKNQVHVQGLTTKIANEDTLAQLKTSELFSQYGRIQKMFMSRRTGPTSLYTPDARYQHVNLYINFSRNHEALACIQGIDSSTLPDGHRLKASLGSTKYCASFLRGIKCANDNCTGAHELAEEVEGGGTAAREEMSTARHAQKESEHRNPVKPGGFQPSGQPSSSTAAHTMPSAVALPATASWATKSNCQSQPGSPAAHSLSLHHPPMNGVTSRPFGKMSTAPGSKSNYNSPSKPRQSSPPTSYSSGPVNVSRTTALNRSYAVGADKSQTMSDVNHGSDVLANQLEKPSRIDENRKPELIDQQSDPSKPTASPTSNINPPSAPMYPSTSHPPGLPPPGLTPHPPGLDQSTSNLSNFTPSSLPPGLAPLTNHTHEPIIWQSSFGGNSPNTAGVLKSNTPTTSQDLNVLSSFSPNFGSRRTSAIGGLSDQSFGSLRSLLPSGYSGSFNPFADTDFPLFRAKEDAGALASQQESRGTRAENSLNDRRGSRFGFARRESSGMGIASGAVASSPLRSIFSQPGDSESPKAPNRVLNQDRTGLSIGVSRFQDSNSQLSSNATEDITPDASVLFPGVNLAASYSANALPAALARGVRSPGILSSSSLQHMDTQVGGFRPLSASRDQLSMQSNRPGRQAVISPTSFNHLNATNQLDHASSRERRTELNSSVFNLSGQFAKGTEPSTEFQDPAILNMRMANNTTSAYISGPLLQATGDANHPISEVYPPFSLNTGFHTLMNSGRPSMPTGTNQDVSSPYNFSGIHTAATGSSRHHPQPYYGLAGIAGQGLVGGALQRDAQRQHR